MTYESTVTQPKWSKVSLRQQKLPTLISAPHAAYFLVPDVQYTSTVNCFTNYKKKKTQATMRGRALEANINKRISTIKLQSLYLIIKTSAPTIPCMALKVQFTSLKQQQGLEKNTIKRS